MTIFSIYQRTVEGDMEAHAKRNWENEIHIARETEINYMCDLCDEKTPFEYIHRIEADVYLCLNCYNGISSMPGGKIKDSVMRFLMRNVI
jgi:hypothetical protein